MEENIWIGLLVILIVIASVGSYFAYKNYKESTKPIEVFEEHGTISGSPGEGQGANAICPEGMKAVSGTCTSHSPGLVFQGQDLIKTNLNLKHPNAWQCNFGIVEEGTHPYTANVHCR